MAKVTDQDKEHALFATLNELVDSRDASTIARLRPRSRSETPFSYLLWLWHNILKHAVARWRALSEEAKQWWRDNCPPQLKSGYTWFLITCLYGASSAGPFKVGGTFPIGAAYVGTREAEQGVEGSFSVGYSQVGGNAAIG